ncbi:hypothetical protein CYY_003725 [Polysphondylium violaceum]|uniref:Alkyl transferase n=1 Tax=Polysphondylium violaceum TaxID=133409 RepID=A0A8J4UU29_9MYCE|nr:hypothetical protein CYY_003725 [Polysphondylium violaceum]
MKTNQKEEEKEIIIDSDIVKLKNQSIIIQHESDYKATLWNRIYDWVYEKNFNFLCSIIKNGPVPQHIGVIMDGNRRFAKKNNIQTKEGHAQGFNTMVDVCQWGLAVGVKIISVYAFSIENFKRSKTEVDDLMELANQKFEEMTSKSHKLYQLGIRIRVVGDLTPIPEKTKRILSKAVKSTENNNKALLNICLSYTSHQEILHSMRTINQGVQDKHIEIDDINQCLFENCMYIKEDLDILIRTSGEYRLSDFMLWQSTFCNTNFLKILWPDFSFFHFFYILFLYQNNYLFLKNKIQDQFNFNKNNEINNDSESSKKRIENFIELTRNKELKMFESMIDL